MTPLQIETVARQRYNATGDSFFGQDEILNHIYAAELELSTEAKLIEETYSTTSVASQYVYPIPTNAISIKRVEYKTNKLTPITMREWDGMKLSNTITDLQGQPTHYVEWADEIWLFPTPNVTGDTIRILTFDEPAEVTSSSTLEIPSVWHMSIVFFVLAEMYAKDKDFNASTYYRNLWSNEVMKAKRWKQKHAVGDSFRTVQCVDEGVITNLREI